MQIAFAKNLTLLADSTNGSVVTTDPVPLGDADRCFPMVNVHELNGTGPSFQIQAQVSNDGQHWGDIGASEAFNTEGDGQVGTTISIEGAFIRYEFSFSVGSGGPNWVIFDVHCRLFKV